VTNPAELLSAIADRLERAGIPYMVVGSVAGSFHGEPRTTIDIDLVIDPSAESLRRFVDSLPRTVAGESDRQLRDVARILAVSGDVLDREYLDHWIAQLDLGDALQRAEGLASGDSP
jgi:hypothetical protein